MKKSIPMMMCVAAVLLSCGCGASSSGKESEEQEHLDWLGNWAVNYSTTFHKLPAKLADIEKLEQKVELDDVWGTPIDYKITDETYNVGPSAIKGGFVITSAGPDKEMGTDDDMKITHKDVIDSLPNSGQ